MGLEHSHFLLTKIEHDSTIFPPLLLTYTFDVLDHIRQHNQPNTICYALYTMHYALCIIHYALYTMHYILCIMYYALFTMHYALITMHYILFIRIYTYSYVFTILYVFIRIHMYSLFHVKIRRNPVISVPTCSSRRVE